MSEIIEDTEIMLTIFSKETYEVNRNYYGRNKIYKCGYNSKRKIRNTNTALKEYIVLEADNDSNKIRGIGYVNPTIKYKGDIYNSEDEKCLKYNSYNVSYLGKFHIKREDMTAEENEIMEILEELIFKGKTHLKRARGIIYFPKKWLERMKHLTDIVKFLKTMKEVRTTNEYCERENTTRTN